MTWQQAGIALFAFAILCEQAHVASPIVLAWSHPGLRRIALSRPLATMVLPVVAIAAALAAPLMAIWWVYWLWNIYHFGAQHYGVARIFGLPVPKWLCVGGTAVLMVGGGLFLNIGWWKWVALVALDFPHWLMDISLSSWVSHRWWLLLLAVLPFGCLGFAWKMPHPDHVATLFVPWVIKARWGVGIAHFIYSAQVWRLRDPLVRAAIGPSLFRAAT